MCPCVHVHVHVHANGHVRSPLFALSLLGVVGLPSWGLLVEGAVLGAALGVDGCQWAAVDADVCRCGFTVSAGVGRGEVSWRGHLCHDNLTFHLGGCTGGLCLRVSG